MAASFLPTFFVPLIGLFLPFVFLAWFFKFVRQDYVS